MELEQVGADCSRRELARHLCRVTEWRGPSGRLQEMSARKLVLQLERAGQVRLPPAGPSPCPRIRTPPPEAREEFAAPLAGSLRKLGPFEVVLISSRYSQASRQWRRVMDQYHYLGAGPLCGDQLRYLVRCARGVVGALSFSAAARQLAARDQWIGWDQAARRENLYRVVNNSRFLILPHVQIPNLASHVLGRVLRRLPKDWEARYHYRPVLAETFVDQERFPGGCYRAANWQAIGLTTGRGRQDAHHRRRGPRKVLWVYPLTKDFRKALLPMPDHPRLPRHPPPAAASPNPLPQDWAEEEFAQAPLRDRRLSQRLCVLARDLYARPSAQLPQACGSRAKTKAAYRLLSHPRLTMHSGLQSHYEATTRRMGSESVVLAIQDTTSLNYSAHPATEMLGLIGTEPQGPIGMFLHSTLAFNEAGTPLGLLQVQSWVRDPEDRGKRHQRYHLPLEAKESVRWLRSLETVAAVQAECPQTQVVSVGDREADIFELFVWTQDHPEGPALLVRAERDRMLPEEQGRLWEKVSTHPVAGRLELNVPRRPGRAARQAVLEVRYRAVELAPPKRKKDLPSVRLWAVLAREVNAPQGIKPLEWMLLSTLEVNTLESALEKLRWYAGRWGIEVFHRVLKSGCKIETRQLAGADRLEACLAIDLVVAWRIYYLTKLGRETPDLPCTVFFEDYQ